MASAVHKGAPVQMLCLSWRGPRNVQLQKPYTRATRNGLSIQPAPLLTAPCSNTSLGVGGEHAYALGKSKLGVTQCCFWLFLETWGGEAKNIPSEPGKFAL